MLFLEQLPLYNQKNFTVSADLRDLIQYSYISYNNIYYQAILQSLILDLLFDVLFAFVFRSVE